MAASLPGFLVASSADPATHAQHAQELASGLWLDLVAKWALPGHAAASTIGLARRCLMAS
jgi:hypothetical protein